MEDKWLEEELKTVRNLCDVSLILISQMQVGLLPTILELLYKETQDIIDEYCIVRD